MPKPFITYAPHRRDRAEWIAECLKGLGFEAPVFTTVEDSKTARKKVSEDIESADCCVAILSPEEATATAGAALAPWIFRDITLAEDRDIPFALIREKGMPKPSKAMEEGSVESLEVDFSDDASVLAFVPSLCRIANSLRKVTDKSGPGGQAMYPFYNDLIHIINEWSVNEWKHYRTIILTALKAVSCIDHGVDTGMDSTGSVSVRLEDWERDLKVQCLSEPGRISEPVQLENTDREVLYRLDFNPPLKAGETIQYRHESVHKMIFPLTLDKLNKHKRLAGCPPFMKDGYIGEGFDIARPVGKLVLELDVPIELGLTTPQVKVFQLGTITELVDEAERIGTPQTQPRFWRIIEDTARGRWHCQVTIEKPNVCSYYLMVRPSK